MAKELSPEMGRLVQKLGQAIHDSVQESEHIPQIIALLLERHGLHVAIFMEAQIGLSPIDESSSSGQPNSTPREVQPKILPDGTFAKGTFTEKDIRTFLRDLRIRF